MLSISTTASCILRWPEEEEEVWLFCNDTPDTPVSFRMDGWESVVVSFKLPPADSHPPVFAMAARVGLMLFCDDMTDSQHMITINANPTSLVYPRVLLVEGCSTSPSCCASRRPDVIVWFGCVVFSCALLSTAVYFFRSRSVDEMTESLARLCRVCS